jgi:hypothetical protein
MWDCAAPSYPPSTGMLPTPSTTVTHPVDSNIVEVSIAVSAAAFHVLMVRFIGVPFLLV